MHWFQAVAPIRQKLLVASNALLAVMTLSTLVALIAPILVALPIVAVLILGTAIQCARYRKAIADPYVATVVRMEALAVGDLTSPIQFTDYQDCVGRMTKAMLNFRDAAIAQQRLAQEQDEAVQRLGSQLERLSQGDLTAEIGEGFPAGYALLRTNYNAALASLRGLIGSVTESASTIHTGSGEIAQASEDLARRTEANAASLQQTAAAVSQMDQRLKATAEAANRTVGRADGAIATVSGGRAIADEAVQAMTRVADSAKGIDSVIEGLDKIAFQTRVLAMNAAVEAGRAGEAGRGFAVVADLVSALAMRSEEEAKRAREQLTTTREDIGTAVGAVEDVDGALAGISGSVEQVLSLVSGMAEENRVQATTIVEIATAVNDIDRATQQNAAMVEQTSAAARSLATEADGLNRSAGRFKTGDALVARTAAGSSVGHAQPLSSRSHGPEHITSIN